MRAVREQPRVAAARALGAVLLVVVGVLLGAANFGADESAERAMQVRLVSAERGAQDRSARLLQMGSDLDEARAALRRAERRIARLDRANARLERDLRRSQRARRRAARRRR